jgi:hypothetical protein
VNTYFFTFEVKMEGKDFLKLVGVDDEAERFNKILPVWKSAQAWRKWMRKKLGVKMYIQKLTYTGHPNNNVQW